MALCERQNASELDAGVCWPRCSQKNPGPTWYNCCARSPAFVSFFISEKTKRLAPPLLPHLCAEILLAAAVHVPLPCQLSHLQGQAHGGVRAGGQGYTGAIALPENRCCKQNRTSAICLALWTDASQAGALRQSHQLPQLATPMYLLPIKKSSCPLPATHPLLQLPLKLTPLGLGSLQQGCQAHDLRRSRARMLTPVRYMYCPAHMYCPEPARRIYTTHTLE